MYERDHLYIGGEWVAPAAGGRIDVVNPATEARDRARTAGVERRRRPRGRRGARRVRTRSLATHRRPTTRADALVAMAEYLTRAGAPTGRAQHRRSRRADHVRARPRAGPGSGVRLLRAASPAPSRGREVRQGALAPALVVREPVGVIGAVVPFNGPIMSAAAKLAPGTGVGMPDRVQARRRRPRSTRSCSRRRPRRPASRRASLNIVPGGADVGAALVAHDGIDRVAVHRQHRPPGARDLRGVRRARSSG